MAADSRIKLLSHERNFGQGGARNTGIAQASANYIANVDCDDWIDIDMIETLYTHSECETVDIVCCGWKRVSENGELLDVRGRPPARHINTHNTVNIFDVLNPAVWNKLIRKNLLLNNDIRFPHYLAFEDLATTPRICLLYTSPSPRD